METIKLSEIQKAKNILILSGDIQINKIKKELLKYDEDILVIIFDKSYNTQKYLKINNALSKFNKKTVSLKFFNWNAFHSGLVKKWNSHKISFDKIDHIYHNLKKENLKLVDFLKKIYGDEKIELAIKKLILEKLHTYLEKFNVYKAIYEHNTKSMMIINSNEFKFFEKKLGMFKQHNYKVIQFTNVAKIIFTNIKLLALFLIYPIIAILSCRKIRFKQNSNKKLAIRVYKGGFRVNSKPSIDWILESKIKKNSAIFVIEDKIDKKFLEEIKSKNYSYYICTNKTPSRELNLNWLIKLIFYYPFIILNKIPNLIFSNLLIKEIVVYTYINYFKWNIFNSNYKPKVYFSYHNYETMHILRNIILNKNDCSSIMYKHTFSENVFDESGNYNNVSQGFNFHQKEFHWGKPSIEMAKKDKNESEKFEIIGPIWTSEHFIEEKQSNIENKNLNNIILSAFSTGFDNFGAINDVETHMNFILFLGKILKLKKNYKIIYKPKFDMKWAKERNIEFFNYLKKMEMNENFSIAGGEISSKIIERSDIVISMPFASTTVEALALKKKSFFVDLKNNFPNSMYKNYDGLVANSEDQAFKKLEFWVNMNQENFLKYYNDKISDIFAKTNNTFAANKIINQVNDLMK